MLTSATWRRLRRYAGWAAIAAASLAAGTATHERLLRTGVDELSRAAMRKVDLYYASLESEVGRYEYLPGLLDLDARVPAFLREPTPAKAAEVNRLLASIAQKARASVLYLLTDQGLVVGASNWNDLGSPIGENMAFRPSFQEALHKGQGRLYATSTVGGEPGYYFAREVVADGRTLGVAMIEADLESIEKTWWPGNDRAMVTDHNGVVILSSTQEWKYKAQRPLEPAVEERVRATQQYNRHRIGVLGWRELAKLDDGGLLVRLPTPTEHGMQPLLFVARSLTMPRTGWTVTVLSDARGVADDATHAAFAAGLGAALLGVLAMLWQARRQVAAQRRAAREALAAANSQLEQRVQERTAELQRKSEELLQAGKLATLGQMAAGITHELNQPLHAMRLHGSNALQFLQRQQPEGIERNLRAMLELSDRMARITAQLRSFARKGTVELDDVKLARAVENAAALLAERVSAQGVRLDIDVAPELQARCDGHRLEQVLVNLLANALDALRGRPEPRITVQARRHAGRIAVVVHDNGPGLPEAVLQRLFEPFFTTKPSGEGLGLGLVISASILRAFGSELRAGNAADGGARFEFDLESSHDV